MKSTTPYTKAIDAYNEKIGRVPWQVMKWAPITRKTEALARDLTQAVETGKPIQDWNGYVGLSPKSSVDHA